MRAVLPLAIWLLAVSPAAPQDDSDAAWKLVVRLAHVRQKVSAALKEQPDFTCLATFDRYHRSPGDRQERKMDTVRVEVAYVGGKELYSWPGSDKFTDTPLTAMVAVGMMGDGDFAVHAHSVFVANSGIDTWAGEEQEIGRWGPKERKLWRWDYRISPYQSGWTIASGMAEQTVGSAGSFWVDAQTMDLVGMETHATDFLPSFPLRAVTSTVNYGRVRIGDQDALLPLRAELVTTANDGTENRNLTEYTNCRQYAGQSKITFGDPPDTAPSTPAAAPSPGVKEGRLPAGLSLQIRLSDTLDLSSAAVGKQIEGTLSAPLRDRFAEVAPRGATVWGRVRYLVRDTTEGKLAGPAEPFTELGLSFDRIEFAGHVYHFAASLATFDNAPPGVLMTIAHEHAEANKGIVRETLSPTHIPGVSTFFVDPRGIGLPKSALMTWITHD